MKQYLEFIALKILFKIVILLPAKVNYWLAKRLGELSFLLLTKRRKLTIDNLTHAFSNQYHEKEIRRLAIDTYRNFGKSAIEFMSFAKMNKDNVDNFVTIKGLENLDDAKKKGKGVIMFSGHLGNWELTVKALTLKGYPLNLMIRRQKNVLVEELTARHRGFKTLSHNLSPMELLGILKNNEILVMIADQDVGERGVFVDFFGRPASTPVGPVILSMRSNAEIVPFFDIRMENNHHQTIIEPAYPLIKTSDRKKDIVVNIERLTKKLELYIRQYPDQWFWIHNRWATKKGGVRSKE